MPFWESRSNVNGGQNAGDFGVFFDPIDGNGDGVGYLLPRVGEDLLSNQLAHDEPLGLVGHQGQGDSSTDPAPVYGSGLAGDHPGSLP